jgi:poly(ADP-ribose) glycohydrolase ARH3
LNVILNNVQAAMLQTEIVSWEAYFSSPMRMRELAICREVAAAFQIKATEALACAITSFCFHYKAPKDAVIAAVHYGGDTDTVASITGALIGALHGHRWIPPVWLQNMEDRDKIAKLMKEFATFTPS